MDNLNFIALDFETANHYRKSVCSIGMVKVENGKIVDEFYSLVKPTPFNFEPLFTRIHGLNEVDCFKAPEFNRIWSSISSWFNNQIILGHNVSFEKSVLKHLSLEYQIDFNVLEFMCSLNISRKLLPGLENHKLPKVYNYLFNKKMKHHNALDDARAAAEIMISFQSGHYIGIKNNPITDGSSNSLTPQLTQTYHLLLEKKSVSEISEIRGFTKDTIYKHTLKIVEINGIDCIHHLRPDDTTIMKVHDAVTELENNTLLKPIYEYLNERVSYDEIKMCLLFLDEIQ
jgi:DNA polymerase-3 subunit epsilon